MANAFESPFKGRLLSEQVTNPNIIVGGNRAKPIRKRFAEAEIALLLEMHWWDWTDEQLAGAMPLFTSNRIADLHVYWQSKILTR